jgi:hypothetical protein
MWNLAELVFVLTLASGPESIPSAPHSPPASAVSTGDKSLGVSPGDRVRFSTKGKRGTTEGSVVAADSDTLLLTLSGAEKPVRIPWPSLKRLEVHRGQRSQADKGGTIGALALGIPLALLSVVAGRGSIDCESSCPSGSPDLTAALLGGAAGATVGALTGALIGNAVKTDRWDKVGLLPIHLSLTPQRRGGMAVALSLRF